jgi:NOL1/NOP2/fmu family ribosome biogenesis protein
MLMPHLGRGEGHFLALLEKRGAMNAEEAPPATWAEARPAVGREDLWRPFVDFMEDNVLDRGTLEAYQGPFALRGQYLYQTPGGGLPSLSGLKTLRPGFFLGRLRNGRFEPSQALAMELNPRHMRRALQLDRNDPRLNRFLKGETLLTEGSKGWTLVCLEEWPLGFGKQSEGYLKNRYHPGWRTGW